MAGMEGLTTNLRGAADIYGVDYATAKRWIAEEKTREERFPGAYRQGREWVIPLEGPEGHVRHTLASFSVAVDTAEALESWHGAALTAASKIAREAALAFATSGTTEQLVALREALMALEGVRAAGSAVTTARAAAWRKAHEHDAAFDASMRALQTERARRSPKPKARP